MFWLGRKTLSGSYLAFSAAPGVVHPVDGLDPLLPLAAADVVDVGSV